MSLTPPKRLFNITTLSTIMYKDVVDDVKNKGYVAISHVWGKQTPYPANTFGITGVDWDIPLSDPDKISRLASAMMEYDMEYCWFDVLCMPQNKQDEINLEIPFMGDYYNGADITLVLSDNIHAIPDKFGAWSLMVKDAMESERRFTDDETNWMRSDKDNLLKFHEDEWFERVWTLQEAVLSQKLVMVNKDNSYMDLSNIITWAGYLYGQDIISYAHTFGDGSHILSAMDTTITKHKSKTLDLAGVLDDTNSRKCYKSHDRFYGTLGILGYKDFKVDYNLDMDELNKIIIQHSHSKGDISWLAVGGNIGTGFIQPMYIPFPYIGMYWRENDGNICDVFFENNTLALNSMIFGKVVNSKKRTNKGNSEEFTTWISSTFAQWGFSDENILHTVIGFVESHDAYHHAGAKFMREMRGQNFATAFSNCYMSLDDHGAKYLEDVIIKIGLLHRIAAMITIVNVTVSLLETTVPLIVCGDVDIGDEILLTNFHDKAERNLGIISSGSTRKGVCLLPRVKMSSEKRSALFSIREFV